MRRSITAIAALLTISCGSQDQPGNGAAATNAAAPDTTAGAAGGGGGGGGAAAATAAFQPGEWEMTTTISRMNVSGMPAGITMPVTPPVTVRHCMTAEQAAAPNANFLMGKSDGSGCTATDMSMTGGRLQGTIQCNQAGTSTRVVMDGRFTPTSYEINQQIAVEAAGTSTEMEARVAARRVGDCGAK